jgi:ankyrin repeat protein
MGNVHGAQLWAAAQRGDVAGARELVARAGRGALIDSIHVAAWNNHAGTVAVLLKGLSPAILNVLHDRAGFLPLHRACVAGSNDAVMVLLQAKADIDRGDGERGFTPCMCAARHGRADTMRILVEARADVDRKDRTYRGGAPLVSAASRGFTDVVQVLVDARADLKVVRSWDDTTALVRAAARGREEVLHVLVAGKVDVNAPVKGKTPMQHAVEDQGHAAVGLLLKVKADVGPVSLVCAAEMASFPIVDMLLRAKADVDAHKGTRGDPAQPGFTPLMVAGDRTDKADVTRRLIRAKAALDLAETERGRTALFLAAEDTMTYKVRVLLRAKADVDKCTLGGYTPLHHAARNKKPGIMRLLLHAKADVDRGVQGTGETALHLAANESDLPCVLALLQAKADANKLQVDDWTPLHLAASSGCGAIASHLLLAKADIDRAKRAEGLTALHFAVSRHDNAMVMLLLHSRADPSRTDAAGRTAHDLLLLLENKYGGDDDDDDDYSAITKDTRRLLRAPGPRSSLL